MGVCPNCSKRVAAVVPVAMVEVITIVLEDEKITTMKALATMAVVIQIMTRITMIRIRTRVMPTTTAVAKTRKRRKILQ